MLRDIRSLFQSPAGGDGATLKGVDGLAKTILSIPRVLRSFQCHVALRGGNLLLSE